MSTDLHVVQSFAAAPEQVFALITDRTFQQERLTATGGGDPAVTDLTAGDGTATVVTQQTIPASVLPSMVANMLPGDPLIIRTEKWRTDGDGYVADFDVVIKNAPASLKGTMTLAAADAGSTLTVDGSASVPIPLFGGKIEGVIVEQVSKLLAGEETFTQGKLAG